MADSIGILSKQIAELRRENEKLSLQLEELTAEANKRYQDAQAYNDKLERENLHLKTQFREATDIIHQLIVMFKLERKQYWIMDNAQAFMAKVTEEEE